MQSWQNINYYDERLAREQQGLFVHRTINQEHTTILIKILRTI